MALKGSTRKLMKTLKTFNKLNGIKRGGQHQQLYRGQTARSLKTGRARLGSKGLHSYINQKFGS